MARVLRSVKGHVYAYQVARLGDGRREQRYIGPATAQEVAAWQERRNVSKDSVPEAQGRPQSEPRGIDDGRDTTAVAMLPIGNIEGRGFWRDGQQPGAFMREIMAIYAQRTGHAPALAICNPGQVANLQGHGVEVRAARVNARCVILAGVSDAQQ